MRLSSLAFAGLIPLVCALPAQAQQARVAQDCAGPTLNLRDGAGFVVDQFGRLCTNVATGGAANQGAAAADVPGNRWPVLAYQGGAWTVGVSSLPSLVTGTASIGTVGINAGTNPIGSVLADLRVAGAPNAAGNPIFAQVTNFPAIQTIAGTVTANLVDTRSTGTLNVASTANTLTIPVPQGASTLSYAITGLTASGATIALNGAADGTNYAAMTSYGRAGSSAITTGQTGDSTGARIVPVAGLQSLQLAVTAAGTGSITMAYTFSAATFAPQAHNVSAAPGGVTTIARVAGSSPATTNATAIKSAAARMYKVKGCNLSTADLTYHFTNTTTAPTPGSTPVFEAITVPASATAGKCNPFSFDMMDLGWSFSVGLGFWVSTGTADTDATAPAAGAYTHSIAYQ